MKTAIIILMGLMLFGCGKKDDHECVVAEEYNIIPQKVVFIPGDYYKNVGKTRTQLVTDSLNILTRGVINCTVGDTVRIWRWCHYRSYYSTVNGEHSGRIDRVRVVRKAKP